MMYVLVPGVRRQRQTTAGNYAELSIDEVLQYMKPFYPSCIPEAVGVGATVIEFTYWASPALDLPVEQLADLCDHAVAVTAAMPLVEAVVLQFTSSIATFAVEAAPSSFVYDGFPGDKTASHRIFHGSVWVGTVHLARGDPIALSGDCPWKPAPFVAISSTNRTYEKTFHPNTETETSDTTMLPPFLSGGRVPTLTTVMWVRIQDGLANGVAVGQIHLAVWESCPRWERITLA
ncbi:hypothetical protein GQ44DRAFT_492666 [Phaeosphaeriaceae sp. PMI808]|nr:hypothetical protein GQ44DRAFT_492666 [Phaeosphaeriaceae sp. PMI808]